MEDVQGRKRSLESPSSASATEPDSMIVAKKKHATQTQKTSGLEQLPGAEMYERSYMHRDVVDHVCVTKTEFVITSSVDGYVKFWKKQKRGIEFVKGFRAHLGAILAQAASHDGQMFATASSDKQIKVFDVANFDMFGIISAPCIPSAICWVRDPLDQSTCIAVADSESPVVYVFDPYGSPEPKRVIKGIHRQPVKLMAYNHAYGCMVSIDKGGMVEYWAIEEPHGLPPLVDFELKSQTDLYEFKKSKCAPNSLELSADFEMFVCTSIGDSTIRVFKFSTGRLYRKYDESAAAGNSIQNNCEGGLFKLDDMEFGRRMAVENEVVKSPAGAKMNAVFDASGRFLILTSLLGIKIIKLATNRVVKVLGKPEPHRFISIALFQESPDHPASSIDLAASSNPNAKKGTGDPTLFCTAFKKNRFYMFTREEPDHSAQDNSRDVFNERPTREEASLAIEPAKRQVARAAILRTTMGDIHIKLFPEHAPKAVENFATHSKNGYYNSVIFHRVIKRFMIQTGDPLGDGTGGESIWGRAFEDEFTPKLRHDQPYTVSMANAGPCTNGSQFFITTVEKAPWLNDKHTVFGRVTSGMDVVHLIEAAKTDKQDKPFDDISIMNIQVKYEE